MDYETILERARAEAGAEFVAVFARDLAYEWCEVYEAMSCRATNIVRFQCGMFEYLYDDYASLERTGRVAYDPVMEARLVAVSGYSLFQEKARDDFRLKGWVGATEKTFGREWDKGHFIAHSIGGAVDRAEVNVFVQLRALNRGWSSEGKRFREMEAYCETNRGTFCFNRPIYDDQTARPAFFEFGLIKRDGGLWMDRFANH
jgi:hypothetical protein